VSVRDSGSVYVPSTDATRASGTHDRRTKKTS
jgi:hypothetical protein